MAQVDFEKMLEASINGDNDAAKDLFHKFVVAKSRDIYEQLLAEDFDQYNYQSDDEIDEASGDDEKEVDFFDSSEDDGEHDEDGEMSDEDDDSKDDDVEDRVLDLEDALDELRSEFEQLLAGEKEEEENDPDIHGHKLDNLFGDDMDIDDHDESDIKDDAMLEYTIKVPVTHGDNGAYTRSPVAGKNDMGGTTANIARGGSAGQGGTQGGLVNPQAKELNAGNVNVPGSKNADKLKPVSKGHGAEKKGGSDQPGNSKSPIAGRTR